MIATDAAGVSRAAGLLRAFRDDDADTFNAIMRSEYEDDTANPWHTFSALLAICDRMIDFGTQLFDASHEELLQEATRVLLRAVNIEQGETGE